MASLYGVGLSAVPVYPGTPYSFNTFVLDATTDAMEFIAQHTGPADTITHIGFRVGIRTGTPPSYKISFQGVTGAGIPDGTILGAGSPASHVFTPPADTSWDGTFQWIQLDNSIALTRGQLLSVVIKYDSGSVDGSNNITVTRGFVNMDPRGGFPYYITNNAGTRGRGADWPIVAWKSSTAAYGFPIQSFTQTQYSSNSTPDEYAMTFVMPTGSCTSFQLAGVRMVFGLWGAAGKTGKVILYDGTTVLQTITVDTDQFVVAGATADRTLAVYWQESTLSTLTPGTTYRIALQAQETTSNWALTTLDVTANADLAAYPFGINSYLSTRTDAGAWDDTATTKWPMMEPILAGLTADTSSGVGGIIGDGSTW